MSHDLPRASSLPDSAELPWGKVCWLQLWNWSIKCNFQQVWRQTAQILRHYRGMQLGLKFIQLFSVTKEYNDKPKAANFSPGSRLHVLIFCQTGCRFSSFRHIKGNSLYSQTHNDAMTDHVNSLSQKKVEEVVLFPLRCWITSDGEVLLRLVC